MEVQHFQKINGWINCVTFFRISLEEKTHYLLLFTVHCAPQMKYDNFDVDFII